jgi:uncharacterized protein (PEP-CTERM system associated)
MAQNWLFVPTVSSRVTVTDNAALGFTTDASDVVVDVRPSLRLRGSTPRVFLDGTVALEFLSYTRRTQESGVIPEIDLLGRVAAVERVFYVEAAVRALRNYVNPFGARPDSLATDNTVTSSLYRISPFIDSEPVSGLHVRARSDNSKTREDGLAAAVSTAFDGSAYLGHHTASVERDPRPLGWRVEADSTRTRFDGESLPVKIDVARAMVNVAVSDTLSVGLRVGAERNNFALFEGTRSVYGGQLRWQPTERTTLAADRERRFFGDAWHLTFDHRMPHLAWSLRASRDVDTTPESLFKLPATDNVAAVLDSMLTTRFPNPLERAKQVQDLINSQGLPASLPTAINIVAPRLSVTEFGSGTIAFIGTRYSLAFSLFQVRMRDLLDAGPLATGSAVSNNRQFGASMALTHRLTPTATLGIVVDGSRIEALDTVATGGRTTQAGVRGSVRMQVSPRTFTEVGARYRKLVTDVTTSGSESLAYVGLDHTF